MQIIDANNVNDAFPTALNDLILNGKKIASRNGTVIDFGTPVTTVYNYPLERVLFSAERDANPFLHLMDALYCLAGRRDVAWISRFSERMKSYSDDGKLFQGAYGYRWRFHHGYDQLFEVIELLKADPDTRRAVVQMWDGHDLQLSLPGGRMSKDVPCNTAIYFKIRNGYLDMTVTNRSNDLIWGCYGANVVQFSILQEYIAAGVGVPVGKYYQISDSLHAYVDVLDKLNVVNINDETTVYDDPLFEHTPLVTNFDAFDVDLMAFMTDNRTHKYVNTFFPEVALPMANAYAWYRLKAYSKAEEAVAKVQAYDWHKAGVEWLARRAAKRDAATQPIAA